MASYTTSVYVFSPAAPAAQTAQNQNNFFFFFSVHNSPFYLLHASATSSLRRPRRPCAPPSWAHQTRPFSAWCRRCRPATRRSSPNGGDNNNNRVSIAIRFVDVAHSRLCQCRPESCSRFSPLPFVPDRAFLKKQFYCQPSTNMNSAIGLPQTAVHAAHELTIEHLKGGMFVRMSRIGLELHSTTVEPPPPRPPVANSPSTFVTRIQTAVGALTSD
jgi:hypothetical protein